MSRLLVLLPLLLMWPSLAEASPRQSLGEGVRLVVDTRYTDAIPHLRAAIQADPSLAWGWYNLGVAYKNTGQFDQAVTHYRRAYELADTDVFRAQSLYGIGLTYELQRAWPQAEAAWREVLPVISRLENANVLVPIVTQKIELSQRQQR